MGPVRSPSPRGMRSGRMALAMATRRGGLSVRRRLTNKEVLMHEDPGLKKLVRRFPSSPFVQDSLQVLPALAYELTVRAAEAVLAEPGWQATVEAHLFDEALALDEDEVVLEGAIAIGLAAGELSEGSADLEAWCRQRLDDAIALCLWRDEERMIAMHDEDLRKEPRFLRLQAALGTPDSMGLQVSLALNGLPRALRTPLFRLALAGQSLEDLSRESGWSSGLIRDRIERALRSIQASCAALEEVRP